MATNKFFNKRIVIRSYDAPANVERDGLRLQRKLDGSPDIAMLGDTGKTAKIARWYPHRRDEDENALPTPISEMVFGRKTDVQYDTLTGVVRKHTGKGVKAGKGKSAILVAVNVIKIPGYGRVVGAVKDDGYRMNIWCWVIIPNVEIEHYRAAEGVNVCDVGTRIKLFEAKDGADGVVEIAPYAFAGALPKPKQVAKPQKAAKKVAKKEAAKDGVEV
jgi:hypothetical protein